MSRFRHFTMALFSIALILSAVAVHASEPIDARPLPADGGAPFQAFVEHIRVIHEGDIDAIRGAVSPGQWRQGVEETGSDEAALAELRDMLPLLQGMTPSRAEFVDGVGNDEQARLNARTWGGGLFNGGADVSMTQVELIQADGRWYVSGLSTNHE